MGVNVTPTKKKVWDLIDNAIQEQQPLPTDKDNLWAGVKEEWAKIDLATIRSLYNTYNHRIQALVESNGGYTRYQVEYIHLCLSFDVGK
jgi:hypothetical protein